MGIPERLTEDFFIASNYFGLTSADIAKLLGVSEATISRARRSDTYFRASRPHQWATALLFIRLYRAVQRSHPRPRRGKLWLFYFSHYLGATPISLIFTFEGLLEVVKFAEDRARQSKLSRYQLAFTSQISDLNEAESS